MSQSAGPFRLPFRVRYSEVDYQGIVYNSHYLTYFDVAIHEFLYSLPYRYPELRERTGTDFHTVRAVVEWKRPLRLDEDFEVELTIGRIGRSSLTFNLAAMVGAEDAPRATGEIIWVLADRIEHRSVPLPENLLRLIEPYQPA